MCHASLDPKFLARDIEARLAAGSVRMGAAREPVAAGLIGGWARGVSVLIRRGLRAWPVSANGTARNADPSGGRATPATRGGL